MDEVPNNLIVPNNLSENKTTNSQNTKSSNNPKEKSLSKTSSKKSSKKSKKKKKKASFFTILKRTFLSLLLGIIAIVGIGYAVLYFAFDINAVSLILQVNKMSKLVNENEKFTNKFSESDYESLNSKLTSQILTDNAFLISDKQVASYISHEINSQINKDGVSSDFKLAKELNLKLIQIDFFNSSSTSKNYLTDMNVAVKVDLTNIKNEKLSAFPLSVLNKYIPNEMYISATIEILSNENSYSILGKSFEINNLSYKETSSLIKSVNTFVKIGSADELCLKICEPFVKYMIADLDNETLYDAFEVFGAKSYGFYSDGEVDYLIIYKHKLDETAKIEYYNTKNSENINPLIYGVRHNKIVFEPLSCIGYEFVGWFDGEELNSNKIDYTIAWDLKDIKLYAKWQIIEYQIKYDMRGSVTDIPNPTVYTIESEIELNIPHKVVDAEFRGWTFKYTDSKNLVSGYDDPDTNNKIKKGTYGNLTIYARFDDERVLELYADGKVQSDMTIIIGESFSLEQVNNSLDASSVGMSGYSVSKWYSDSSLTKEYNFNEIVRDDMAIYGEWEYVTKILSFYPYISQFNEQILSGKTIEVGSYDEFKALFEYMCFYDISKDVKVKFNYISNSSNFEFDVNSEIDKAVNFIKNNNSLKVGLSLTHLVNRLTKSVTLSLTTTSDGYATKVMDENKLYVNTQVASVLSFNNKQTRSDDYDNFKINNVSKTISVTTSSQLVYCLEQGYKPSPVTGSMAESVYNKAKSVLRKICNDDMNDIEKLLAMYEWLILNVNYDQLALQKSNTLSVSELLKYNSWFAEGVFDSGNAVCEGYAKAFIIMSRIEGIPMVFVTGNGHAWNKVMVNNKWYGIDATHGDLSSSNNEYLTYREFLFSDSYKENKGYATSDYSEFVANTDYNYYSKVNYTYAGKTFDLYIESANDVEDIADFVLYVAENKDYSNYTFEIEVDYHLNYALIINRFKFVLNTQISYIQYTNFNGNGVFLLIC